MITFLHTILFRNSDLAVPALILYLTSMTGYPEKDHQVFYNLYFDKNFYVLYLYQNI